MHALQNRSSNFFFCYHNRYTSDGGLNWKPFTFSDSSILAQDVVTQPGERLPIFLIYGTSGNGRPWKVFYVNMTAVLGRLIYSQFKCVMIIIGQEVENISNTVIQQTVGRAFQVNVPFVVFQHFFSYFTEVLVSGSLNDRFKECMHSFTGYPPF